MSRKKRKSKKKRNYRHPRQERIIATVTALTDDLCLAYDTQNNKVEFPDSRVDFVQQQVLYQRASGKEKVLSVVPGAREGGHLATYDQLKKNFDLLFAIDTNTRTIKGSRATRLDSAEPKELSPSTATAMTR